MTQNTETLQQNSQWIQLKDDGNAYFKNEQYKEAIQSYNKALKVNGCDNDTKNACFKNLAACYLKLKDYNSTLQYCNKALEILNFDTKALFRRCQANFELKNYEDSYKDALEIFKKEPKNQAVQSILTKLNPIIQNKVDELQSTDNKITQMLKLAFDSSQTDKEKQKQALSNLIVLARDYSNVINLLKMDTLLKIITLLQNDNDMDIKITCVRLLACFAKHSRELADEVLSKFPIENILKLFSVKNENLSVAIGHFFEKLLTSLVDLEKWKNKKLEHEKLRKEDFKLRSYGEIREKFDPVYLDKAEMLLKGLLSLINQFKIPGFSRDNVLEIFTKLVSRKDDGLGWTKEFLNFGGLHKLLEISGCLPEEPSVPITKNTRRHTILLLSKLFDDMRDEKEHALFKKIVDDYFTDMFGDDIMESKLQALLTLAALLQGPFEIGNYILGREGILQLILALADSGDTKSIKVAVEALVYSSSKKERCSGVIQQATPILRKLYQHPNKSIKARALVGLCKLSSFGGSDASIKPYQGTSDESSQYEFVDECAEFLKSTNLPEDDIDLKRWSAEGLAYLSLNADIKEEFIDDTKAIQALISLSKDKQSIYPVMQIFVNLSNSFDKKEIDKELLELAKFSKQHVPEDHEKDTKDYVEKRVKKLIECGIINCLVSCSVTSDVESDATRECIARLFLACCQEQTHRGLIVQQGGGKALLNLYKNNTKIGKLKAAQSLAKITITNNPDIVFPGQRIVEVVRPLLSLLAIENSALENFESLMALTNLISLRNESVFKRFMAEKGFSLIEHYVFEEHEMLRRAAVECVCNLVMFEDVEKLFLGENDRVKLLVLYCAEQDDEALIRAASGALAILSGNEEVCEKIVTCTDQWIEILGLLVSHPVVDIQHRALHIVANLTAASESVCKKVIESVLFEAVQAVSQLLEKENGDENVKMCAKQVFKNANQYGLIAKVT